MPTSDIIKLKVELEGLKRDVQHIGEDVGEIKDDIKELHNLMTTMAEVTEKRYAAKWAERVLIWLGVGMGGAIVAALMKQLLK